MGGTRIMTTSTHVTARAGNRSQNYLKTTVTVVSKTMQTLLSDLTDATMLYGKNAGRRYSWVVAHDPGYIAWARTQIPTCGTELFRLVQYADHLRYATQAMGRFEAVWGPLRQRHIQHMQARKTALAGTSIPAPTVNGTWVPKSNHRVYSFMD